MTGNMEASCFRDIPRLVAQAFAIAAGAVVRIEVPVPPLDPLKWLHAQRAAVKTYWADRDGGFTMAGVGAAHTVSGDECVPPYGALFERLRAGLSCAHPNLRYYGGLRFDAGRGADPCWARWGTYRFVIPRFEVLRAEAGCSFVCNAHCGDGHVADEVAAIERELAELTLREDERPGAAPRLLSRTDRPERERWSAMIADALGAFQRGDLKKVVLARESRFEFASPPDPLCILRRLSNAVGNAYLLMFQPCEGQSFLGASPERLYRRIGGYIQSEALAGTRPRGDSEAADAAFADVLLHDDKELREHGYVADGIRGAFESLCRDVREEEAVSLVRLRDCQHLIRRFEGMLAAGKGEAEILEALHPSPAVGGAPGRAALDWIAREEPFDRGWYAGPVGWVGYESSEFAVGIRSGLIDGNALSLYAGAGIVPGSDAAREWAEIESKLETFFTVLKQDG